jgi:D-methionine transport system substrate-binding protein
MKSMKKFLALTLSLVFCVALLAGCTSKTPPVEPEGEDDGTATVIKVAATPAPHAEILEVAKGILAEEGITLEIVEFTDYIQPNMATESGDVDANYFQHIAYLNSFNPDNNTHLVNAAEIHYEPYGLYPGKTATIADLPDGAQIAVPNDPSNEVRALRLLEAQGLITLREGVDLEATKLDIVENPKNLEIVEMEAASLPGALSSVDMAVINGNYAIGAGLSVTDDTVAIEDPASENVTQYANILAVKEGNENSEAIQALIRALKSDTVRDFINSTYGGAVVPLF